MMTMPQRPICVQASVVGRDCCMATSGDGTVTMDSQVQTVGSGTPWSNPVWAVPASTAPGHRPRLPGGDKCPVQQSQRRHNSSA